MKKLLPVFGLIAVSFFAFQCVKPQLDDSVAVTGAPNLTTAQPYLDADFQESLSQDFNVTNLFKGNGFVINTGCFFCTTSGNELDELTESGVALGRALFYDPRLSANNDVSCGSCHSQAKGFSDPKSASMGIIGENTSRNTMALTNLAYDNGFFWRHDVRSLQEQILDPVKKHIEMGSQDLAKLSAKLSKTDFYPGLFQAAYGTSDINEERISHALTQFLGRMISRESAFDHREEVPLSALENQGSAIFASSCGGCHNLAVGNTTPGFYYSPAMPLVSNIGLDNTDALAARDGGFKIPSLRNISLTAPYMHDGRFSTLEEVVEHYSTGVKDNPNLDVRLRNGQNQPIHFNFTSYEKSALVAFLKTLTDPSFVNDERFSNPFN